MKENAGETNKQKIMRKNKLNNGKNIVFLHNGT